MATVGCKWRMDDLDPYQWRDLIILAQERQWIEDQLQQQREATRKEGEVIAKGMDEARKLSGAPPPGRSLFGPGGKR